MKILVCIKHVPDTEMKVKIGPDGRSIDEAGVKMVISPFDEYALEEALLLKESSGAEVVVAGCGREAAQASLRQALAMGADRAVAVQHEGFDRADALTRARALAAVAAAEGADLVFFGKTGVGADEGQTGPMTAELLDRPHVAAVVEFAIEGDRFRAKRAVEGATEIVEGTLPAAVAWEKTGHEPRYPSLKGIMAAKKKPLDVKTPADLGIPAPDRSLVQWESLELPPPRQAGRLVPGDAAEAARELARLLREEAKVI